MHVGKVTGNAVLSEDTLSELQAQLGIYRDNALGYHEGELGVRARTGWEYYYGDLPKPITQGSSSWVDRSVWETVNGVTQELSNVFTSGEEAVKFSPLHKFDGDASVAATKLVNNILLQKNDGFNVLNDAFKEACVTRNSFIKRYWCETVKTEVVKLSGVTEDEVDAIISTLPADVDEDLIDLQIEYDEETGVGEGQVSVRIPEEKVKVEFVPFEQVIIEPTATAIENTNYMAHRVRKTKDELIQMGFDEETVEAMSPASSDIEAGVIANARINNISPLNVADVVMVGDDRADKVWLYEEYIQTSCASGTMELLQVFTINRQILEVNRVNDIPFDTITPFPIPGYIWGESVVDITKDIQDLNSFTVRGMIDNMLNANFRRYVGVKGQYDRRSLLDSRPGGVVEVNSPGAVDILPYHQLPQGTQYLLEYVEQKKEQRTGVTRLGQGLNPDVFKNDNAYATVDTMLSAAQNRLRMVCRNVAYTGMQSLMKSIYKLYRENGKQPIPVDTAKGQVLMDPKTLPPRDKMMVSLAIGTNERRERGQTLISMYGQLLNSPVANNVLPNQHYHWSTEILKSMGLHDVENFVTAPEDMPPPPEPTPVQKMQEQAMAESIKKVQAEILKLQTDAEVKSGEFEFTQAKTADEFSMKNEESLSSQDEAADKMALEERKIALEEARIALESRKVAVEEGQLQLNRERVIIETQIEAQQKRAVAISGGKHSK